MLSGMGAWRPGCRRVVGARRSRRSAFTLIELLVVIAVIALLVSILLPALARARESSKGIRCLNNLKAFGAAVALYAHANKEHYPLSSHTVVNVTDARAWRASLEQYGVTAVVRECPLDPVRGRRWTTYATNEQFEPLAPGVDFNPFTKATLPGGRTRALDRTYLTPRPATTVHVVEINYSINSLGLIGTEDHTHSIGWTKPEQFGAAILARMHRTGANYSFADSHAAPISWAEISSTFSAERNILDPLRAP